jgi:hypothetical protein
MVCCKEWFCQFELTFTLPPWSVSTDFGTCSFQCFSSNCTPVSLHVLKCGCAHTLSCLFKYCSFASIGNADIIWSIVSSNCYLFAICLFNIFVAYYIVCNAWSCAATISRSVSVYKSPFESQRNVSSAPISCLSTFLVCCSYINLFLHLFFKTSPSLPFVCCIPSCFASLFSFG